MCLKPILKALRDGMEIHGMTHITGGGLSENLPRCLEFGQSIVIEFERWQPLPIFQWIAETGQIKFEDMLDTFNMGICYVVLVPSEQATTTLAWFQSRHLEVFAIGEVVPGQGQFIGR